jgi:multidrug efflux pump subunit AcrB
MKLAKQAISNYQFAIIIILLLVISGAVSFLSMPRSEDPQISPPGTSVITVFPGASPADMEELLIDPIESKINELDDIKRINSYCRDGLSITAVEFDTSADMDEAYSQIVQKINSIRSDLPRDILELSIQRWNLSDHVIVLQLALLSETAPYQVLDEEARRLEKLLEKVPGVKKVRRWGIPEREVRVSLEMEKLAQHRIPMNRVIQAVQAANFNIPGGHIDAGSRRFNIKTSGSFESVDQIKETIIQAFGDKVVHLKDVADVRFSYPDDLYFSRVNGRRGVFVTINQKDQTNIFKVMGAIDEQLAVFGEKLPSSITLERVFDQSTSVSRRLNSFFLNLFQGLLLVGIVIFFAIGLRASFIVILAIPISIFISLGFVDLSGYGLQQMTIAGFIIALGLLVDNAIVVTEVISRFIAKGTSRIEAAVKGTSQVGWAIVSSTATTVLAFFPIAMLGYTTGDFIRSMPVTVIFALSASLLVALTLTPFLSSRMLTVDSCRRESAVRRLLNRLITQTYRPALNLVLKRPKSLLALVFLIFMASLFLSRFVGISFFPKAEKPQLVININTPEGSNLDRTDEAARRVEGLLETMPQIVTYATTIGRGNPQIHYNIESKEPTASHAQIFLKLNISDYRQIEGLIGSLREKFRDFPGERIEIKELEQGPPVEAPIAIKILGENMDVLSRTARDVEDIFLAAPGTVNVNNPQKAARTDLRIRINRAKAGLLGIPIVEIDRTIRAGIAGIPISRYRDKEGKEYDIVVRLPLKGKVRLSDLDRIYVNSLTGAAVPLRQIASAEFESSFLEIDHFNFDRAATITADVEPGYTVDEVTTGIIKKLDGYTWPKGYRYYVSGQKESQEESFGGMGRAIIIALIAIFAVLVLQFKSFAQPLIVFTAIPLALIGSILALLVTGNSFSFTAFIGLTSLVGIVVNNSIILVDYTNQLRNEGKTVSEALKVAGETRFIPIILTSATTIGGLLPLTLRGGTLYAPMGWTIIGGLMVSTFLTLIVVPVLYTLYTPKSSGAQNQ